LKENKNKEVSNKMRIYLSYQQTYKGL